MSSPGLPPTALTYLPSWWQETTDPTALDALLIGWVRAAGLRAGGFVWPADGVPTVAKTAPASGSEPIAPAELAEVVRRVRAGEPAVLMTLPSGTNRVYAPVGFPGRPAGVVWAERPAGQPWADTDQAYVALTGKALERSPAVVQAVGPVIDPDRLTQRLADAAVIASRMAHDFDNILTGILGFADLTVPMLSPGSQAASFVTEIAKVGQRGITFTQQLHQLSRGADVKPTPGSVVATLGREEVRLKPGMHPGLRVEKDLPANLPAVAVEAGPLQTALGHLFENAVEACPQGGTVRIAARQIDLTDADARTFLGKAAVGPHVLVTIADSGTGIKPETRRRLFAEPFHTTKIRHRGLGLAVVYRIVTAHRGGIQIDPVPPPGTGTQVKVVLPLVVARPSVAVPTPPPAQAGLREDTVRPGLSVNAATPVRG